MFRRIIMSLLLLLFFQYAQAGTEITGAFGIKFGESISNLKVLETLASGVTHVVEPPNPLDSLRLYTVEATKEKNKYIESLVNHWLMTRCSALRN